MNARQSLIAAGSIEDRSGVVTLSRSRIVRLEVTLASALITASFAWSWARGLGLLAQLQVSWITLGVGAAGALFLCLSLPFLTSAWAARVLWLREMRNLWDELLIPLGKSLTLYEIAILALLSGVSEELFFRGVLQAEIGILGASLLFGLLHRLNLSYVVWATCVGFALGVLFRMTGSLLPSIVCHAGYNLAALLYVRYWHLGESRDSVLLAG